jgi:hypothetical protein
MALETFPRFHKMRIEIEVSAGGIDEERGAKCNEGMNFPFHAWRWLDATYSYKHH